MQVPLEVLVGPVGAVGALLLWIWDLRKERDAWRDRSLASDGRLERIADAFTALAKKPAPK